MISWFARFKNRFGKLQKNMKKGDEKVMQKTLENHQKSHPKSMPKPLKNHPKIDAKKVMIFRCPAGIARESVGPGKSTSNQQDTYRHPTERQQKADNLKEDYQKEDYLHVSHIIGQVNLRKM